MTGVQSCQPGTAELLARENDAEIARITGLLFDEINKNKELTKALTEIDTLATCTGVVDPALHRNMLDNIYRIARRGLAMPLERSGGAT